MDHRNENRELRIRWYVGVILENTPARLVDRMLTGDILIRMFFCGDRGHPDHENLMSVAKSCCLASVSSFET